LKHKLITQAAKNVQIHYYMSTTAKLLEIRRIKKGNYIKLWLQNLVKVYILGNKFIPAKLENIVYFCIIRASFCNKMSVVRYTSSSKITNSKRSEKKILWASDTPLTYDICIVCISADMRLAISLMLLLLANKATTQ
jgi:hypothetical protein